jgi:membrane protein DedA with SNARE-associated domain
MQALMLDNLTGPVAYMVLAGGLLLGAFGLPIPASLIATLAGGMVADGDLDPGATLVVALTACLAGDLLGYALGRQLGRRVLEPDHWYSLNPRWLGGLDAWFSRWAGLAMLLTRSVFAIAGAAVNLLAGASRQRLSAFLAYDLLGRGVWVVLFVGAGYVAAGTATTMAGADLLSTLSGPLGLAGMAAIGVMARSPRLLAQPVKR